MVILRPTKKAMTRLGAAPDRAEGATTSKLGDWYLNVVPTVAGELFVFVSSTTLLTVAIPVRETDIGKLFVLRVANLLAMIGISVNGIERELEHFRELRFAKPLSRSTQGSASEIAFQLQMIAEKEAAPNKPLSLSKAENYLSDIPHAPLAFASPRELALEILGGENPA